LKKIIYQIFDILIFLRFLGFKKCRIGKNRQEMAVFGLQRAKKSRKIKKIKYLVDDFLQNISESICIEIGW